MTLSRETLLNLQLVTLELKLDVFIYELERRYNPNWPSQPRVPGGEPIGPGRWTAEGSQGVGTVRSPTAKPIQTALAGRLIGQRVGLGDDRLMRMCTYEDIFGQQFSREFDASILCPRTLKVPFKYGSD